MDAVVLVEVRDLRERLVARHRVERWPLTIGRAYSNDLILEDPYVCASHLRVIRTLTGALEAEDLGSVNGVQLVGDGARVQRVRLDPAARLRIGNTLLRFVDPDVEVPPALVRGRRERDLPWLLRRPMLWVCWLGVPLWLLGYRDLMLYERPRSSTLLGYAVLALLGMAAWAAAWALLNRVVSHRWRFVPHAAAGSAFFAVALGRDQVEGYVGMLAGGTWMGTVIGALCHVLPLAWLLGLHLAVVDHLSVAARRVGAFGAAVAFVGLTGFLADWSRFEFSNDIDFDAELRPLPRAWIPGAPLTALEGDVAALQAEVRRLAEER